MRKNLIVLMTCVLSIMLISCTSTATFKEETIKNDILSYLKNFSDVQEVTTLNVKSQKSVKGETVVETAFDFSNKDATFSAEMTLAYGKVDGKWKVVDHTFNLVSTNTTNVDTDVVAAFIAKNPSFYFVSDVESYFLPEYLNLDSTAKNSSTSTTMVYKYSIKKFNWTFNETYTVEANFSYPNVWQYTIKDWSYVDSSEWAGTWQIKFYNTDGTLAETINNIVITGVASISDDMSDNRIEKDTLLAKFTRKGKNYSIPARLHNGSNGIELILDGNWLLMGIHYTIDSTSGDAIGFEYYTADALHVKGGILTKIK